MPYLETRMKGLSSDQRLVLRLCPPPSDKLGTTQWEYKYKLVGTPRQNDPVLYAIRSAVRQLEKDNICMAGAGIRVQNLLSSPPIWPLVPGNVNCAVKLYAFKKQWEEFPRAISVTIGDRWSGNPSYLAADRLLVRKGRKWKPLKAWLVEWAEEYEYGHIAYNANDAMCKWWGKNGKTFRFVDLPPELRLHVLKYVLGGQIRPHTQSHYQTGQKIVVLGSMNQNNPHGSVFKSSECFTLDRMARRHAVARVPFPNYAIFRVSKQVRDEASQAGWKGTTKYFHGLHYFSEVVRCPNPPDIEGWLSKVYLDLSITEYFRLFGVQATPRILRQPGLCQGELFRSIPKLDLTLSFRSPYIDDGENPWSKFIGNNWGQHSFQGQFGNMRKFPCYRIVVDWILTFAFPFVKNITNVRLSGCIKTAIKQKWNHILETEYRERKEDNRTHGFDWEEAMEAILNEPVSAM